MQVFRVLIFSEICQNSGSTILLHDFCRDTADNLEKFKKQLIVSRFKRQQRRDVSFRDHNDVCLPKRACVVIGEHVFSLMNPIDFNKSIQYVLAVKVLGHKLNSTNFIKNRVTGKLVV